MTTWVFEGTILPAAADARLLFGAGEIDLLVQHGLTVEQTLVAASTGAQDFLGLTGDGNLVTYDADPREHPEVLASPAAVVLNHRRVR